MRACLAKAGISEIRRRVWTEARKRGARSADSGISSYIECTAWGEGEEGSVALEKNGDFTVLIGTQSNGQGHETAYAQVVSQYLDVPLERIKVVQGDTDRISDRQWNRRVALDSRRRGDGDARLADAGGLA